VLATGKVAHELLTARDEMGVPVAVIRVDQLYPWPYDQLDELVAGYPNATELMWLQEEPENMGAWNFAKGRLYERFDDTHAIHRLSRYESGSPATGSHAVASQEQAHLLATALDVGS
jgi:2-oxoglutarate dehydrogenase E1 component